MSSSKISIKVFFNGDIRRAPFAIDGSFSDLQALVSKLFKVERSKITYKDEDGDKVLILSNDEVAEAIRDAKAQGKVLRLYVVEKAEDKQSAPVEAPVENTPKASSPLEETKSGSSVSSNDFEFVDKDESTYPKLNKKEAKTVLKAQKSAFKAQRKAEKAAEKCWRKAKKAQFKAEKAQAKEERKRAKEERSCNNDEGKRGNCNWRRFRQQWREQRNETRKEFCEEIKSFLEDEKVIKAIQDSLPVVADLLVKAEKDLKEIIEIVLESQPVLKNHALVQRTLPMIHGFLNFIPTGIIGPILLDVVLDLQGLFKDGKPEMPIRRIIKRIFRSVKQSARRCSSEQNKEETHGWQPPCAFGIPGFHPGPFAFMNMFGGGRPHRGFGPFGGMFGGPFGGPCGPFGGPRGARGPHGRHHRHGRHGRHGHHSPRHQAEETRHQAEETHPQVNEDNGEWEQTQTNEESV